MVVPVAMAYASMFAPPGEEGRSMSTINIAIFCGIGAFRLSADLAAIPARTEASSSVEYL